MSAGRSVGREIGNKSNPDIFVMQSAKDRAAKFTVRDRGASLSKAKCVRVSL
jgi:hypothetical protein